MYLLIAGVLEVCWAVGLKYTEGLTKPLPTALTAVALAGSMFCLARATHALPISTAYAVWVGIGACGAAVAGVILFGESMTAMKGVFLAMLVVSILGLKLSA